MSSNDPNRSPVVRFLGEDAGKGGPFALLGLTHDIEDDQAIRKAQQRRLRQIDCHPHRSTPDADEVRLAVHSATSQLLDPALRPELARRWPEGTPMDLPKAWVPNRAMHRLTPMFVRRARMIVGSSGGWNPVARRRLAHLARLNRISALEVVRALGSGQRQPSADERTRSPAALPSLPEAPTGGDWIGAYALLGLLACGLFVTLVINPIGQRGAESVGPAMNESSISSAGSSSPAAKVDTQPQSTAGERTRLTHYTAVAHELDQLVARAGLEPRATMERFKVIYPRLIEDWISFPLPALERAATNVAVCMVRLQNAGVAPEEIVPLLAVAGRSPLREMVSSAVIDVVLASPELSTDSRSLIRELRSRMSDTPIVPRAQVVPILIDLADAQAQGQTGDDVEWWTAWIEGMLHATSGSAKDRDRLVIDALTTRLLDPSMPDVLWLQTASLLVAILDWRDESSERYWLLGQFGDSAVSTPRLGMLTEALVTSSRAAGIDAQMVLEINANGPQREQLARIYQAALLPDRSRSSDDAGRDTDADLIRQLRIAVTTTSDRLDEQQAADAMVDLVNLNGAAYLRSVGQDASAEELLLNPYTLPQVSSPSTSLELDRSQRDDEWAQRAMNTDSVSALRPLLDELLLGEGPGINSAHALVFLATLKPQNDIRDAARAYLVRYRDQISVLLALDHALATSRVTVRLDELATVFLQTSLPDRNDPDWFPQARRAVLVRLADAIGQEQRPQIDSLAGVLASVHQLQLADGIASGIGVEAMPDRVLEAFNTQARLRLEPLAQNTPRLIRELKRVDAQALVRRARAGSPMHRYLAALMHSFEMRAIELDATRPGASRRVIDIRADLDTRMDSARTVLEQAVQVQRSIARLWVIDFELGGAP